MLCAPGTPPRVRRNMPTFSSCGHMRMCASNAHRECKLEKMDKTTTALSMRRRTCSYAAQMSSRAWPQQQRRCVRAWLARAWWRVRRPRSLSAPGKGADDAPRVDLDPTPGTCKDRSSCCGSMHVPRHATTEHRRAVVHRRDTQLFLRPERALQLHILPIDLPFRLAQAQ